MRSESGNAFFITLVSVVLLGALTIVVARQMGGGHVQGISAEKATLYANQIISQATGASSVVQQLLETGATVDTINYDLPDDPGFNAGNTLVKLFHPSGGGLSAPKDIPADMVGQGSFNRTKYGIEYVEWTPSAASDVAMGVFDLRLKVCAAINKRLTGSETIPAFDNTGSWEDFGLGGLNLDAAGCPGCDGKLMLCVHDTAYNFYAFYAVLYGR